MKTQIEKLPQSRVALQIEVDPERVEQSIDRAYRRIVRSLNIPGFRQGRAPRALVEMRLGWESLLQEALDELLPEVYVQAVEEAKLQPVGEPSFDVQEAAKGQPLRLKAEVDVKPAVELPPYKGLTGERVIRKVSDEDVEDVLKAYQERFTQLVVPDRDVVEKGDFAILDFDGFIDDEPFSGGAARGVTIEVGSGQMIDGFEDQLVGHRVGETFDVRVTFPSDESFREDLRGRDAVFRVTVKELKVKQVPPIDDELAKESGEADTLEEWRDIIRQRLEEHAREDAESRLRDTLFSQVAEAAAMELPQSLLEHEIDHLVQDLERSLARDGITLDEYLEHTETDMQGLREQLRARADARVRSWLVVDAIAEQENIEVSDEEIAAEKEKMAAGMLAQVGNEEAREMMRSRLMADTTMDQRIIDVLRVRKVGDLLVGEAQITERWVDSLEEDEEAADGAAEGSPEDEQ